MKERRKCSWLLTILFTSLISGMILWHIVGNLLLYYPPQPPAYITRSQWYNFTYPVHLLNGHDYNSLVNYTFYFTMLNPDCDQDTFLLILVHSAPANFWKRSVIRDTWGNKTERSVRLHFVLGAPQSSKIQRQLETENRLHRDLIQGNFLDSYRNLTYKHIVSLKYAIYHCPRAKYVLKTDDDVFVNVPLLKNFLTVDLSPYGTSDLLFCAVERSAMVMRSYRSKWRATFGEYPARMYPPYCPGWGILYSPDVLFKLYNSTQNTPEVFWIDDVHVTGSMAAANGIVHTDSRDVIISKKAQVDLVSLLVLPDKPFLFGRPDLKENDIRRMWKGVRSHSVPRSVFNY